MISESLGSVGMPFAYCNLIKDKGSVVVTEISHTVKEFSLENILVEISC